MNSGLLTFYQQENNEVGKMQEQEIESYLAELGQELQNLGVQYPIRILLVGGAFMLTQIHNRSTTNDVDVLLKDGEDSTTAPRYQIFRAAVRAVARHNKLPSNWLNDIMGDFLRDTGTAPDGTLWRTYTMLEVYMPPSDYVLALKLFAGRPKDRDDIHSLCQQLPIRTRKQAQRLVDRYIPNRQVQQLNHLDDTLDDLFP
jgi:hypothetical protein